MQVTTELDVFEGNIRDKELLKLGFAHIDENRARLEAQLIELVKENKTSYFGESIKEFISNYANALLKADITLLHTAVEEYCSTVHKGNDRAGSDIVTRCPSYMLRCHPGHPEVHVIVMAKDIRDRLIHALPSYNKITCGCDPLPLLKQDVVLRQCLGYRYVVLRNSDLKEQYVKRWEPPSGDAPINFSSMTFAELLSNEVVECIRTYDSVRKMKPERASAESTKRHIPIKYG